MSTPFWAVVIKYSWSRTRHLLVDSLGLLLKVVVHPALLHNHLGAKLLLGALGAAFPRLWLGRA